MNITFTTKLTLVLVSGILAYSNRIDIDAFCRGIYDLDTVVERFDEIQAAIANPSDTTMYPYSDPEVQDFMKASMWVDDGNVRKIKALSRALANENMKLSEFLLSRDVDLDMIIYQLMVMKESMRLCCFLCENPAMIEHATINTVGITRHIEWFENIKQRNVAQWNRMTSLLEC